MEAENLPENAPAAASEFWAYLDRLVAANPLVLDRPKGSAHPRYPDLIYPLDYGYLQGTTTVDGGGIDVWAGSRPERELDALVLTVDLVKQDAEPKLLLGCTETDKQVILDFLNGDAMQAVLVRRVNDPRAGLYARLSVRRFLPRPVARLTLERILETATWAPSAHNRQPWRFAVLDSPGARERLADAMGADFRRDLLADGLPMDTVAVQVQRSRQRLLEAPAAILLCLDASLGDVYPDTRRQQAEYLMGAQGVAMSGANLLLAAQAEGLGGVWVCAPLFTPETARCALDLPDTWEPQGLVLLGYPAKIPERRPRRPVGELTRFL